MVEEKRKSEEPGAALAEYVSRSFDFAEKIRYIDHSGDYALAYFLARQIEQGYGVSFLREALELKLELSVHAPTRKIPLRARILETISKGMSTLRIMTNVIRNVKKRPTDEGSEW